MYDIRVAIAGTGSLGPAYTGEVILRSNEEQRWVTLRQEEIN